MGFSFCRVFGAFPRDSVFSGVCLVFCSAWRKLDPNAPAIRSSGLSHPCYLFSVDRTVLAWIGFCKLPSFFPRIYGALRSCQCVRFYFCLVWLLSPVLWLGFGGVFGFLCFGVFFGLSFLVLAALGPFPLVSRTLNSWIMNVISLT